jgi:hypothetical protein
MFLRMNSPPLSTPGDAAPTAHNSGTGSRQGTSGKTLLVVSQTFVPDPAAVGQYMTQVAFEMARRGHKVVVYASSRSYEDASVEYPLKEVLNGVEIRRIPFSSFGKKSILHRIAGTASFMTQVALRMLFKPRLSGIFFSTSPPLVGLAATIVGALRNIPTAYWAMDLNPDQLIAMGKIGPDSAKAKLLENVNRFILSRTRLIFALDRFMRERLLKRGDYDDKLIVMPPWPLEEITEPVNHADNAFRKQHNPDGKFVVMYSGNHSPANPLTTLLDAAVRLQHRSDILFMFVGGGLGKKEVEQYKQQHNLANVISLPYQPLETLRWSLSAADAHVVSLGENMVGIIHPCKIYGAMIVARPILFFGPKPSHVSDLIDVHGFGLHVSHGDTDAAVKAIEQLAATPASKLADMGTTAQGIMAQSLTQHALCGKFCDHLEEVFGDPRGVPGKAVNRDLAGIRTR